MEFDENGWAVGVVRPIEPTLAYSLLSPDASSRVHAERWTHQAATFFGARLSVSPVKLYPKGAEPIADALDVEIELKTGGAKARVRVVTTPLDRAREVRERAEAGVRAIGGAGFDALLDRARRVWQVRDRVEEGGDGFASAPLVVAAVMASVFLAPIVPPDEVTIYGVKGARERIERIDRRARSAS